MDHGKPWEVERPKHKQTQSNLGLTIIENDISCKNPRTLHLKKNIRNEQNWKDNTYIGWFSQEEFHRAIQLVSAWEPGIDNFRPSGNTIPQDRHSLGYLCMRELRLNIYRNLWCDWSHYSNCFDFDGIGML